MSGKPLVRQAPILIASMSTQAAVVQRYDGSWYWKATTLPLRKVTTLEG